MCLLNYSGTHMCCMHTICAWPMWIWYLLNTHIISTICACDMYYIRIKIERVLLHQWCMCVVNSWSVHNKCIFHVRIYVDMIFSINMRSNTARAPDMMCRVLQCVAHPYVLQCVAHPYVLQCVAHPYTMCGPVNHNDYDVWSSQS